VDVSWRGSQSANKSTCPFDVIFHAKPGPAQSLNSLESGRLIISVVLGRPPDIREAAAELFNNAKSENIDPMSGSELKRTTSVRTSLTWSDNTGVWAGELSIPASWTEGSTSSYERTGSFSLTDNPENFSLEFSYVTNSGNHCKAHFGSTDAYHWADAK
jgi:hypothetical protein